MLHSKLIASVALESVAIVGIAIVSIAPQPASTAPQRGSRVGCRHAPHRRASEQRTSSAHPSPAEGTTRYTAKGCRVVPSWRHWRPAAGYLARQSAGVTCASNLPTRSPPTPRPPPPGGIDSGEWANERGGGRRPNPNPNQAAATCCGSRSAAVSFAPAFCSLATASDDPVSDDPAAPVASPASPASQTSPALPVLSGVSAASGIGCGSPRHCRYHACSRQLSSVGCCLRGPLAASEAAARRT